MCNRALRIFLLGFLILVLNGFLINSSRQLHRASAAGEKICRFNITVPRPLTGFEDKFPEIRVAAYMDWAHRVTPQQPNGVEYLQVLRVSNSTYPSSQSAIPTVVPANPGSFWAIGNEPDRRYWQDDVLAETYADRYYNLATAIRALDPTARIGFGSIVQPTPIRLRYLDRAWNRLIQLAGSQEAASDLIDWWNIHAFILNEQLNDYGADVPPGFESDWADAESHSVTCADGHCIDMTIFTTRVVNFRQWLNARGERDKPVWITEYGNLFPEYYVSAANTANFMTSTFDYLRSATDGSTGYPFDTNHLVQGWFWHSLNNNTDYDYGGNLYENNGTRNTVGDAFVAYVAPLTALADPYPAGLSAVSAGGTDYTFTLFVANQGDATFLGGYDLQLFDGDPDAGGVQLGSTLNQTADLRGCGEFHQYSLTLSMPSPTPWDLYLRYLPTIPVGDSDLSNNTQSFGPFRPQTFLDTPPSHPFWGSVERLYADGYVAGCSSTPMRFCPDDTMNRAEGSVFVERGVHDATYDPPDPTVQVFIDVPLTEWYADWVDGLWNDGYTAGCAGSIPEVDLEYCPLDENTRAEGSVFFVRMLHGPAFTPPQPTVQIFDDVYVDPGDPANNAWYAKWVHQAYNDGIIDPCQETPSMLFCPDDPMSRGLAADMMVRSKGLTPLP